MGERRVTADGRILEKMPDGSIVEVGRQGGGGPQPGAIPLGPRSGAQSRADAAEARAQQDQNIQLRAEQRAQTDQQWQAEAAHRQALEWQATHNPDGSPKQVRNVRPMPDTAARRLESDVGTFGTLDRLANSFNPEFGGNTITGGLENTIQRRVDSFGTPGQAQWWQDQGAMDNIVRNQLFGASLTSGEQQAWNATSINPSMDPKQIEANLQRRREILQGALARRNTFLKANGYDPEAVDALYGEYGPAIMGQTQPQQRQDQPPIIGAIPGQSSMADHDTGGSGPASPASGALLGPKQRQEYDWDAQKRINSLIYSNAPYEQIDAEARRLGYTGGISRIEYDRVTEYRRKHPEFRGSLVNAPLRTVDQSMLERGAQGAPGATAIGYTNAATYGGVGMLAPEKMAMAQQAHPIAEGIGEIAGVFAGQKMGGNILGGLGNRIAPGVAGRMSAGFNALPAPARNLIADAGYGTVRGAVENPDDPLAGALMGGGAAGAGSVVGQGFGKGARFALGGARQAPGVRALLNSNIPLTVGQRMGGMVRGVEDRMASMPVVSDMIRGRRMDTREALVQATQNQAGEPIGAAFRTADDWTDALPPQFGRSYSDAVSGTKVGLDDALNLEQRAVQQAVDELPQPYRDAYGNIVNHSYGKELGGGELTGEGYQNLMQTLKRAKGKADNIGDGVYAPEYKTALSNAQQALREQMVRGGGAKVASGLDSADQAYRMAKTVQAAQQAAKGKLPTPTQLSTASMRSFLRYGGGRPFGTLLDSAQKIIPDVIPNSGTADRMAQMAGLGALSSGVGGGVGYASGGLDGAASGATTGLTIAALLAAGGTRRGQAGLNALLFERPKALRDASTLVLKKQGLLGTNVQRAAGTATLPLLIQSYQQ